MVPQELITGCAGHGLEGQGGVGMRDARCRGEKSAGVHGSHELPVPPVQVRGSAVLMGPGWGSHRYPSARLLSFLRGSQQGEGLYLPPRGEAPCPPQVGLAGGTVTAYQCIIDWSYRYGSDNTITGFDFMFKSSLQ